MSPVALPQAGLEELRGQADKVRQRLQGSGAGFQDFARFAELSGSRAIVAPGKSVRVRVLPRWDISQQYIRKGDELIRNPKYPEKQRVLIYVPATAHWIVSPVTGKSQRLWCRLLLNKLPKADPDAQPERCPICEAAVALMSGSEEDRKMAKDIRGKECYLFNAIIKGSHGENTYNDKGEPDIRILNAPPTVFVSIIDIMTGGPDSQAEFAKGEIFDPKEGFDLMITRPASGGTDRYKVACANTSTPLFTAADASKWKAWTSKLHDLAAEVGPEAILSFADMWKHFYGREPDEGEDTTQPTDAGGEATDAGFNGAEETAVDPGQFDAAAEAPADTDEGVPAEFDGIGFPGTEMEAPEPPPARTPPPAARPSAPKAAPPAASRPSAPRPPARRR